MHHSLQTWLSHTDQLLVFTPSRWPHRELISRATALIIIAVILGLRLYRFFWFPGTLSGTQAVYGVITSAAGIPIFSPEQVLLLWSIKLAVWSTETLIFVGYIAAYATRVEAVKIAHGFRETAFPIMVAGAPILISFKTYAYPQWLAHTPVEEMTFYMIIMAMIFLGGLLNLMGLLTMRRAFTVMAEARTLITNGIFGYIRHPLYTSSLIMFFGSLLLRLSWTTLFFYLLYVVGQITRAVIEERKMMQAFPQYVEYRARTGMFFPKLR